METARRRTVLAVLVVATLALSGCTRMLPPQKAFSGDPPDEAGTAEIEWNIEPNPDRYRGADVRARIVRINDERVHRWHPRVVVEEGAHVVKILCIDGLTRRGGSNDIGVGWGEITVEGGKNYLLLGQSKSYRYGSGHKFGPWGEHVDSLDYNAYTVRTPLIGDWVRTTPQRYGRVCEPMLYHSSR